MRYSTIARAGLILWCGLTLTALGCGGSGDGGSSQGDDTIEIAVIPKGTTHEFWKAIHAGAIKAANEEGVKVIWKGPLKEDDREDQIQIMDTFISAHVDAIVLAPLDNRSLMMPVRDAKAQKIPTVVIDSNLDGDAHISFVATDNYKGGQIAARHLAGLMGGKGSLVMLRYQEGSASTSNREAGFYDTMNDEYPDITFLSDNQYAGPTTETAYRSAENLLNRFTDIDAVFTPNESSTFGFLRALQDQGLTDDIIFVGFDSSQKLIEALAAGEIKGLVLQNPFMMGYLGVKTASSYLRGEKIEKRIDTGVTLATPENMNEPEIMNLLSPNLDAYLNE